MGPPVSCSFSSPTQLSTALQFSRLRINNNKMICWVSVGSGSTGVWILFAGDPAVGETQKG
ncbi:predicted protein [Uncinocarpus reesii 1704]|uniref:Uncharacterized protein n=1 Tax=Uncinocarpus reesii (strain UAMH 1704) TaxID=336963 RepID=C4JW21_UNCRE|nr:uncharacterized protein UREG_06763 [Uncinocarpus reesii 1704]EEP81898.1 predicted protein [Uncinocarpus reesii 1704]